MVTSADTSKDPARIASMFDAIANRYDLLNHVLSAGLDLRWRKRALAALDLTGREVLLDVCTGTADLALGARTGKCSARRVVAVDFAGAMLSRAHAKIRRAGLSRSIALVRGDAMRLPVRDGSCDGVTVAFGIRNVSDPAAACREMRRVLRAGGRLAILEFAMPRQPLVRAVYGFYFRRILPLIGRAISGHDEAYSYLPASVGTFTTPEEFAAQLVLAGFLEVRARPLTLGAVYLYTATAERSGVNGTAARPEDPPLRDPIASRRPLI